MTFLKTLTASLIAVVLAVPAYAENAKQQTAKPQVAAKTVVKTTTAATPAAAATSAIPKISEADLKDPDEPSAAQLAAAKPVIVNPKAKPVEDAAETGTLRLSPDAPQILHLDREAVNVLVGSNQNLRVVPDTNKTLLLIPQKPGTTYFQALDAQGKIIMQRHVIIGSPKSEYIRIRRTCAAGQTGCQQYSVYYCPDMCHEVSVVQNASGAPGAIPEQAPGSLPPAAETAPAASAAPAAGNSPPATPVVSEPPPGQ